MINKINNIINQFINEYKLPKQGLCLLENKSGKTISYSVIINEQPFPIINENVINRSMIIFNFLTMNSGITELVIKNKLIDNLDIPKSLTVKEVKSDKINHHLLMMNDDINGIELIKQLIDKCIKGYVSTNSFGCCSKYKMCSKIKECLHENKLYSTGCMYRNKIENNLIYFDGE